MEKTAIVGQIFKYTSPLYDLFNGRQINEKMPYNFDIYDKNTNEFKGVMALFFDDADQADNKISDMYFHLSFIVPNENEPLSISKLAIQLPTFIDLNAIPQGNLENVIGDFERKFILRFSWLFPNINFQPINS